MPQTLQLLLKKGLVATAFDGDSVAKKDAVDEKAYRATLAQRLKNAKNSSAALDWSAKFARIGNDTSDEFGIWSRSR